MQYYRTFKFFTRLVAKRMHEIMPSSMLQAVHSKLIEAMVVWQNSYFSHSPISMTFSTFQTSRFSVCKQKFCWKAILRDGFSIESAFIFMCYFLQKTHITEQRPFMRVFPSGTHFSAEWTEAMPIKCPAQGRSILTAMVWTIDLCIQKPTTYLYD